MRIAQILLPNALEYERKSQRADRAALSERHEVFVTTPDGAQNADVAHVYASGELPSAPFVGFRVPYVSSVDVRKSRWPLRRPVPPRQLLTPESLPEVVEDIFFSRQPAFGTGRGQKIIGSFGRESTRNAVEQTLSRIHRFREDIRWKVFADPPAPNDLAGVDLWADPAVEENDYDGFVAEALVVGLPVVASRTRINAQRLEQGRTGLLVPPRDPNEMTHAILAALFKSEVAQAKIQAARQTVSKFRSRHRMRVLVPIYESLIP